MFFFASIEKVVAFVLVKLIHVKICRCKFHIPCKFASNEFLFVVNSLLSLCLKWEFWDSWITLEKNDLRCRFYVKFHPRRCSLRILRESSKNLMWFLRESSALSKLVFNQKLEVCKSLVDFKKSVSVEFTPNAACKSSSILRRGPLRSGSDGICIMAMWCAVSKPMWWIRKSPFEPKKRD